MKLERSIKFGPSVLVRQVRHPCHTSVLGSVFCSKEEQPSSVTLRSESWHPKDIDHERFHRPKISGPNSGRVLRRSQEGPE